MSEKYEWEKQFLELRMWHCGDEVCDCHQPQLERLAPNTIAGFPWIKRERIWSGTFHSEPDIEELEEMQSELKAKAKEYGIKLDENFYGRKEVKP